MNSIAISKFKATCLSVLDEVARTGEPVLVTKRGEPVAEVVPASHPAAGLRELGTLRGTAKITGDIVAPALEADAWEALSS